MFEFRFYADIVWFVWLIILVILEYVKRSEDEIHGSCFLFSFFFIASFSVLRLFERNVCTNYIFLKVCACDYVFVCVLIIMFCHLFYSPQFTHNHVAMKPCCHAPSINLLSFLQNLSFIVMSTHTNTIYAVCDSIFEVIARNGCSS